MRITRNRLLKFASAAPVFEKHAVFKLLAQGAGYLGAGVLGGGELLGRGVLGAGAAGVASGGGLLSTGGKLLGAGALAYPTVTGNSNNTLVDLAAFGPSAAGQGLGSVLHPDGELANEHGYTGYKGELANRLGGVTPQLANADGQSTIMSAARIGKRNSGLVPPPQPQAA